jgi:uncharacterized protein
MRWRQSRQSQNVRDLRGVGGGGGRGGGLKLGLGSIVVLVAAYFLGGPQLVMSLLSGGTGSSAPSSASAPTSTPADEGGQFVSHVLGDTEETWAALFGAAGRDYPEPELNIFGGNVGTGCGPATSAAGPFYCPADRMIYIDLAFFRQLETQFAAQGDFAKAYVIAHEVGHHVQTVLGTSGQTRAAQQRASSEAEANALSVKLELQADCFAGIWAHHADRARALVEAGDIDEALTAAAAVGDDTIQKRTQGNVNQESFTHGSAAERQQWFRRGYGSGQLQDCDTFR